MSQDFPNHLLLGDEGDDAIGASAVALKRIGLMNALDELCPSFPERGTLFWGQFRLRLRFARKLTDAIDGFLRDARFLIHDRDPLFSSSFCATLGAVGVETVKLPARSPNLNAYAERFVRSIKSECLSRMIPLGENHLRASIRAFAAHYHLERNHQGLDNELICSAQDSLGSDGRIRCRERLGGTLRYYYRDAA